uniref:Caspase1like [Acyrthosiphon pisum] n=1 Tax=Lepeophtheirus salmonis TaxID=72036 RepID=A0A0K2UYK0_LEPSM
MLNSITKKWTKSNKPRDSTDASPISTLTDLEYSESSSEFEILSCKSSIHDDAYNLEYGEKRLLIFNQTKFPCYDTCPNDREGVEQDTQAIKDTFNPLGFFIQEHENLTVAQIKHELLSLSSMDNLSCLMIFISTHGEENDVLLAFDKTFNLRKDIMEELSPKKIPSLAGKPKVVFVQACQGSKKDKGILIKYRKSNIHEVDGHGSARQIHKMSTHVDFLLVKSSYHGYFSFRSNTSGSWFIQTVCNEIGKSSPTDDLLSIMPRVIQNVSLNYTSCHEDPAIDQCKQTPMLEVTLLRKIYLKSLDIVESSEANLNSDEYPLTECKCILS